MLPQHKPFLLFLYIDAIHSLSLSIYLSHLLSSTISPSPFTISLSPPQVLSSKWLESKDVLSAVMGQGLPDNTAKVYDAISGVLAMYNNPDNN